ncbi:MAG: glycosyltransferase family 1 protein [Bacteroidetes bacterium]|nr:MAG: glycosyltransferase family 1 protein [Bacteroidota bacterium]TAG89204.1 MAG: glycosyltransferase family 1 protein [Bacteroidota bacterium]
MLNTPILFLVFNRLDTTKQVFAKIREIQPRQLFIGADGARPEKEGEKEKVEAVRKYILENIDWECEVKTLFREQNLGCGVAVSEAITWFFENVEQGIILEDDTLPDLSFFGFCESLLERYKENQKIMMISGTNYLFGKKDKKDIDLDYYYSDLCSIWGWATWKNRWALMENNIKEIDRSNISRRYKNPYFAEAMSNMIQNSISGDLDTWDTKWFYSFIKNDKISIVSINNLISNLGYNGAHAHQDTSPFLNMPTKSIRNLSSLKTKDNIKVNEFLDKIAIDSIVKGDKMKPTLYQKIRYNLSKRISPFKSKLRIIKNKILNPPKKLKLVKNYFKTKYSKTALLSYITYPFIKQIEYKHTNHAECFMIAEALNKLGYNVDIIDWNNTMAIDYKIYDLIFGFGEPLENFYMHEDVNTLKAKKVLYMTGLHGFTVSQLSMQRLKDVYSKTKINMFRSARYVTNLHIFQNNFSDAIINLGNKFVANTYQKYFDNPIYSMPASFHKTYSPNLSEKDFDKSKNHFLWFGSNGIVHKGLDILLEIFKKREDIYLHVCGANSWEKEFFEYYNNVFSNRKNIINHGFIDINSQDFKSILDNCAFTIFPSIGEGGCASVVTAMGNGGLIPIVSLNCGLDVEEFGFVTDEITEHSFEVLINLSLELTTNEIRTKSEKTYKYVNENHSMQMYRNNIFNHLKNILS